MNATHSAEANTEIKVKEKDEKDKKDKGDHGHDPAPYCCTPPDGNGGPDTKP